MHAFGFREFEVHTAYRLCDLCALVSSALAMILLVSQLGMVLVHWADLLPLDLAIALYVGPRS